MKRWPGSCWPFAETMPMLISLGFSCQTRFMIDMLHADLKRQPFDFNITSRAALVNAFATDGASLRHAEERAATYVMPKERREGIEVAGMYFWHDYPLQEDKLALSPDWRLNIDRVNAKYTALWRRFSELVRSDMPKTFVLSNSQHNLNQFAADEGEFDRKFGLGRQAFEEIAEALDAHGGRNYRLKFISRSVQELEETAGLRDGRLDHHFVGALSLRPDSGVVGHLFSGVDETDIHTLHGAYDDGEKHVRPISDKAALILRQVNGEASVWGSLARVNGAFIAAFQGRDQVFTVERRGDALHFSNGIRWMRAPI